ncbi:MAG: SWIM zinc finger family protein [Bacteroidota bacterium]
MSHPPKLTEQDIKAKFNPTYFQRGLKYYQAGYVSNTSISGKILQGKCEGSYANYYRMEVHLGKKGIVKTNCTCPIGGGCKHVIALLLTWVNDPALFREKQSVETYLARLSKQQLIELVEEMLDQEPDLEDLLDKVLPASVEQEVITVNEAQVHRQVKRALSLHTGDWMNVQPVVDELAGIVLKGDQYLAEGAITNACMIYQVLVHDLIHSEELLNDHDGDILTILEEAVVGMMTCLARFETDSAEHLSAVQQLFKVIIKDIELGGYGIHEDIPETLYQHAGAEGLSWVQHQVKAQYEKLRTSNTAAEWEKEQWREVLAKLGVY